MIYKLLVFSFLLASLRAQPISLHRFANAGKYGFKDDDGIVRIPARYEGAMDFAEGLAPVAIIAGEEVYRGGEAGMGCLVQALKWGFVDPAGNAVLPFRYSEVKVFSEGLAAVRSGESWGFIDATGKWVVQPRFGDVGGFYGGLAFVELAGDKGSGYIDRSGKLVIPAKCCIPSWHSPSGDFVKDGIVKVDDLPPWPRQNSYVLFDRTGRTLVKGKGWATLLGEGLVTACARGLCGLMDVFGNTVQPPAFEVIHPFSESLAAVKKNGLWGFIDRKGNVVIPISFAFERSVFVGDIEFHEGLSRVQIEGRFGYIDHTGNLVIAPRFLNADHFNGGLASVCVDTGSSPSSPYELPDTRCGFIDKTGSFVIAPRFGSASAFDGAWAKASDPIRGSEMRINRKGKIVDRPRWEDEPQLEPHGNCHFPPPPPLAPPPKGYWLPISLGSVPAGASVYLIPLWDWQTAQNGTRLLADPDALASYLVTTGTTPLNGIRLKAQVYMVVFDLAGKRKVASLDVAENGVRQMVVTF